MIIWHIFKACKHDHGFSSPSWTHANQHFKISELCTSWIQKSRNLTILNIFLISKRNLINLLTVLWILVSYWNSSFNKPISHASRDSIFHQSERKKRNRNAQYIEFLKEIYPWPNTNSYWPSLTPTSLKTTILWRMYLNMHDTQYKRQKFYNFMYGI